jgi:hypothetical protein
VYLSQWNKLSLGGNNLNMTSLFPPRESLMSDIPAGDGNIEKLSTRRPYLIKTREREIQKIQTAFYSFSHLFVQLLLASFH